VEPNGTKKVIVSESGLASLYGPFDTNLKQLERAFQVRIAARGVEMTIEGEATAADTVAGILTQLSQLAESGYTIQDGDIATAVRVAQQDRRAALKGYFTESRILPSAKKQVSPKSLNQREYVDRIRTLDMVFAIGPAGTGKTYLAVAMALEFLAEKRVERIVLVRPAVEAGEKLGFLPGDLIAKVDPYLRPLYDALYDLTERAHGDALLSNGTIEVAPLAFMRGRTLNDCFVILDEAQNTTREQMKMFLTRIGFGSKAVVTGDVTQIDLARGQKSGMVAAQRILADVRGIAFSSFKSDDVVRHPLVQRIVDAYERHEDE
jgi:phosphate starvation-inducible PhoH-like protein